MNLFVFNIYIDIIYSIIFGKCNLQYEPQEQLSHNE